MGAPISVNQPQQGQMQLQGIELMMSGLRAEYHRQRHQLKTSKCPFDAGFDLYGARVDPEVTQLNDRHKLIKVSTMLHIFIPPQLFGVIKERSSTISSLSGGRLVDGVIDTGYIAEIFVRFVAHVDIFDRVYAAIKDQCIKENALAQLIIIPVMYTVPKVVNGPLPMISGSRANNGFGSTNNLKK